MPRESWSIERLVHWALREQGLGYDRGSGGGGSLSGLGIKVDGGTGGSSGGQWVDEDAIIVHDALQAMLGDARVAEAARLVATHGRAGTTPDWGQMGGGRFELVRNGKGKAKRMYRDQRRSRGLTGFEWQFVGDSPDLLDHKMITYIVWHTALCELKDVVNTRMKGHVATGPRASATPWDDPAPIVLHSDRNMALASGENI